MAVRPDVPGTGQTGPRPLRRPEAEAAVPAEPTAADARPVAPALETPPGVIPRWLLLLMGAATATVAVAGLREIAWLVAPVFLALVVVVALTPVERWLRRTGRRGGWRPPSCWCSSGPCSSASWPCWCWRSRRWPRCCPTTPDPPRT